MEYISKWGFGMAPIKKTVDQQNRRALENVRNFVSGQACASLENLLEDLSIVKGLFKRTIKQDQWDWFTVYMYLDYPSNQDVKSIVNALASLRAAVIKNDDDLGRNSLIKLQNNRFLLYCVNYLNFDITSASSVEYLYILSRREEKDILKIGMTTRNVQKRVNEINSSTGIIYPWAARKVFKVKKSKLVEKEVHHMLSEYRIRKDREFFKINYAKACDIIDQYLCSNHLYFYE